MTEIAYDGPELRSGTMDVKELGPALIAAGALLQNANRVLNGDRAVVEVKVHSRFRRGSFGIDLSVVQGIVQHARGILLGSDIKAAHELLWLLGLGSSQIGLIPLIKWLGKREMPEAIPLPDRRVRLEIEGNSLEFPADVVPLFNDPETRESLRAMIRPLERDGIDSFEVRENKQVVQKITKDEVGFFDPASEQEQVLYDGDRIAPFEVITPSFEERYKWRFSDGNGTFTADIEDHDFFNRLQRREIMFGKGDALEVRLHTHSVQTPTGLRTEHKVLEVLRVIPAARQQILFAKPRS